MQEYLAISVFASSWPPGFFRNSSVSLWFDSGFGCGLTAALRYTLGTFGPFQLQAGATILGVEHDNRSWSS